MGHDNPCRHFSVRNGCVASVEDTELHLSLAHLKYILSGNRRFSIDALVEIACALDVSIYYLLLGEDHKQIEARNKLLNVIGKLSQIAKNYKPIVLILNII